MAIRTYLAAADAFDESVADRLGIGRTDLRCLDLLERQGRLSAGELSRALHLTSGAMTFLLDRLERAGVVRRERDPADRRRVLVALTPQAAQRAWDLHRPLVAELRQAGEAFTPEELAVVVRFLRLSAAVYEANTPATVGADAGARESEGPVAGGRLSRAPREVQRSAQEVRRAVRDAQREVQRSAREAQRSVQQAARDAQREIQHALLSALRDDPGVAPGKLRDDPGVAPGKLRDDPGVAPGKLRDDPGEAPGEPGD